MNPIKIKIDGKIVLGTPTSEQLLKFFRNFILLTKAIDINTGQKTPDSISIFLLSVESVKFQ